MNITEYAGQPRVADLDLATHLGFYDRYKIRNLIERHWLDLQRFGEVSATVAKTSALGGRPGKTFLLNRKQALYICAKSETPRAAEVTIAMVELFDAWLEGKTVKVREHWRRAPTPQPAPLALPPPGLQIEATGSGLRLTVVAEDRVCFLMAAAYCDALAA